MRARPFIRHRSKAIPGKITQPRDVADLNQAVTVLYPNGYQLAKGARQAFGFDPQFSGQHLFPIGQCHLGRSPLGIVKSKQKLRQALGGAAPFQVFDMGDQVMGVIMGGGQDGQMQFGKGVFAGADRAEVKMQHGTVGDASDE